MNGITKTMACFYDGPCPADVSHKAITVLLHREGNSMDDPLIKSWEYDEAERQTGTQTGNWNRRSH